MEGKILLRGASAGSGKTFFLSKTYIRLLLEAYFSEESRKDALKFRHVLAVTFTNKATAEMKERILKELNVLASEPGKSPYYKDFSKSFSKSFSCTDEALKTAARTILCHILHDYGAFSVGTIDSFFQLVLRAFSKEVGYGASYQVELERERLVSEAVDRILDGLDEGENNRETLEWLSRQALRRASVGMKYSADEVLLKVAKDYSKEDYRRALADSGLSEERLYDKQRLQQVEEKCWKEIVVCKQAIKTAAQAVSAERDAVLGETETYKSYLEKGLKPILEMGTGEKDDLKDLSVAFRNRFLSPYDPGKWFTQKNQASFSDEASLGDLPQKLESLRQTLDRNIPLIAALKVIADNLYGLGVVRRVRQEVEALMKEKNVLSLEDTNEILKGLISDTDTPFIYEKVGVRFEHFLLDEFQDTSHVQWNNFRPLMKESVASGHDNLVVGDPKQSIYRWRNSDASLMTKVLPETFAGVLDATHELDTNWRSAREIIEFNNDLFEYLAKALDHELGEDNLLQKIYADVRQKDSGRTGGLVRFEACAPAEADESADNEADDDSSSDDGDSESAQKAKDRKVPAEELKRILSIIQEARQDGYAGSDIAIVVRAGESGETIATFLEEKGIKVSTADTLSIVSSPLIRLLVSLLSSLDDPSDKTNAYLAEKYFPKASLPAEGGSLTDLCENLLRSLKEHRPDDFRGQAAYIRAFMDVVGDFCAKGDNSLHAFLEYLKDNKGKICAPESIDAVNIITIHKVKGLAAPCVIVPAVEKIDLARVDGRGDTVWCQPDLSGTNVEEASEGVYPVKLTAKSYSTGPFAASYQQERRLEFIDNLNLLYVAFTRPIQRLHVIWEPPKVKKDKKGNDVETEKLSFPSLLLRYAQDHMTDCGGGRYECGADTPWKPKEEKTSVVQTLSLDDPWPSFPRGERVKLRKDASDFFSPESHTERYNGTVIHDILSRVIQPEDLPGSVREAMLCGDLEASKERETLDYLSSRLEFAVQKGWFPAPGSPWTVRNEATILMPDEPHDSRTDRVLDNGKQTIIIDYKTGDKHSTYARQMERYARAYLAMGRTEVTTHLWYLEDNEVQTKVFR